MARKSRNLDLLVGPVLVCAGLLALWENEGRFDYHRAAVESFATVSPLEPTEKETASFTGTLAPFALQGRYVKDLEGYLFLEEEAEIYSWHRSEDDDGHVTWRSGWYDSVESNSRNSGLVQRLSSGEWRAERYPLTPMEVSGKSLHFVDETLVISPDTVTLSKQAQDLGLRVRESVLYLGQGGGTQIGDERIRLSGVSQADTVTYFGDIREGVGVVKQFEFRQTWVSGLIGNDGMLHHLVNGNREVALQTMKAHIQKLRWMVRLGGTLGVMIGIGLFCRRLLHFFIGVPLLGAVVEAGVAIFSIVVGGLLSLVAIIVGFLVNHLWVALVILVGVVWMVTLMVQKRKTIASAAKDHLQKASMHAVTPEPSDSPREKASSENETPADSGFEGVGASNEACFKNLAKVALMDGELSKKENDYLAKWGRSKQLSDATIVRLFDEAKKEKAAGLIPTQKDDLLYLIALSLEDGELSTAELKHLHLFGSSLGMSRLEVHKTISTFTQAR